MAGSRQGVGVTERIGGSAGFAPRFEAAINLLREERRASVEVRRTILRDRDLAEADPGHHNALLVQTLKEVGQITRAISILERLESGDLVECETAPTMPVLGRMSVSKGELRPADETPAGLS